MEIHLSWDAHFYGADPRIAALADDVEALRRQNQRIDAANRIWASWLLRAGGESINTEGIAGRATVPADQLQDLEKIRAQVEATVDGVKVGVGVGVKLYDADQALKLAMKRGAACIVFYTDDVPSKLEELDEERDEPGLRKAQVPNQPLAQVAENSPAGGGGFTGATQPGPPADATSPVAEASEHSQGEAMQSLAENAPPVETTHAGADFQQQFSDAADSADQEESQQDAATAQGKQVADLKTAVVQILDEVRKQAPLLEQLRAVEPDLFNAIQGMTRAMLLMAKQLLGVGAVEPASKSEPEHVDDLLKKEALFAAAAFRAADGRVYATGPFHDVSQLPQGFDTAAEGFVDHVGKFYDRDEAAQIAAADHPLQSQELDLDKAERKPRTKKYAATIQLGGEKKEVRALAIGGGLSITPTPKTNIKKEGRGRWALTHEPTGLAITFHDDPNHLHVLRDRLLEVPGWERSKKELVADKPFVARVRATLAEHKVVDPTGEREAKSEGKVEASPEQPPPTGPELHKEEDRPVGWGDGAPVDVQHFSNIGDMKVLDPHYQGTGQPGHEKNRSSRIPRTYFYALPGRPEAHIAGGSRHVYHGQLPKGTKLYDMGADPEGVLTPRWKQTSQGQVYVPTDLDEAERKLKRRGYHGYHNYGVKDAIAYFYPLKVRQVMKKADDLPAEPAVLKEELPLPEAQPRRHLMKYPVGAVKHTGPTGKGDGGKVKVRHSPEEGGKTGWVSVRAGQVLSNDGHPVSSRNPGGK